MRREWLKIQNNKIMKSVLIQSVVVNNNNDNNKFFKKVLTQSVRIKAIVIK